MGKGTHDLVGPLTESLHDGRVPEKNHLSSSCGRRLCVSLWTPIIFDPRLHLIYPIFTFSSIRPNKLIRLYDQYINSIF